MLLSPTLFLLSYGDHRDLHSFPTRRSSDLADRKVGGYSGGMKRRLDLALALVHRPRILFLDEPTTGLDIQSRTALWEEVARDRKSTRLNSSHSSISYAVFCLKKKKKNNYDK